MTINLKSLIGALSFAASLTFSAGVVSTANAATIEITGDTTGGTTWNRPFFTSLSGIGTATPLQAIEFMVDTSGDYDFEILTSAADFDTYLHLYDDNGFDPLDQFTGLQAFDDDGGVGLLSALSATLGDNTSLIAGVLYTIVVSGFNNADFGTFTLEISGPGNISTTAVPLPAALPLFMAGFGGLMAFRRKQSS